MAYNDSGSYQKLSMQLIKTLLSPSPSLQYHVNYNFNFHIANFSILDQTVDEEETVTDSTRVNFRFHPSIPIGKSSLYFSQDMRDAINTVLTCLPLSVSSRGCRDVIEFSLAEASAALRENMDYRFKAVDLHIQVQIQNWFVISEPPGSWESVAMVPAAESSVQLLLKKHEGSTWTEGFCCICHEGLMLDGECCLLSMLCEHVFHGDCINQWLLTSHYCPLCRFQMPTHV